MTQRQTCGGLPDQRANIALSLLAAALLVAAVPQFTTTTGRTLMAAEQASDPSSPEAAGRTILVRTLDGEGKPMPGVNVHVGIWTKESFEHNRDYLSDAQGQATVKLPQTLYILRLWASADGYVSLFAHWERDWLDNGKRTPKEFTFKMLKGTLIGGVIKNEDGKPIEGAKVEARLNHLGEPENEGFPSIWLATGEDARITDKQGKWTLNNVPAGEEYQVTLKLTHPDYISDFEWGLLQRIQAVTTKMLREQKATLTMVRGIRVTGTIADPDGKPLEGAVVVWGDDPYHQNRSDEVRTDAEGVYRLPPLPPAELNVTVIAKGWAPKMRKVRISAETPPVDFQLAPGHALRLKFVDDEDGKPIPGVGVGISGWRGIKSLYNHKHSNVLDTQIPVKAGDDGVYEWTWAPADAVLYSFGKEGYQFREGEAYQAKDEVQEVTLLKRGE